MSTLLSADRNPSDASRHRPRWRCQHRRRGRSFWPLDSCWSSPAWSRTLPSACWGRSWPSRATSAGSVMSCRTSMRNRCSSLRTSCASRPSRPWSNGFRSLPINVRAWLPLQIYPVSAGVKGGLAGGRGDGAAGMRLWIAEAGSIWYPINLLAAAVYFASLKLGPAQIAAFQPDSFAIAVGLHLVSTARRAAVRRDAADVSASADLFGGLIAPVLWSGLLQSILGVIESGARATHRLAVVRRHRRWHSASSPGSSCHGRRVCRRARTCPLAFAPALKLQESCRHEEDGEERAVNRISSSRRFRDAAIPLLSGCAAAPGRRAKVRRRCADRDHGIPTLYAENCAGCHGPEGKDGAAIALADPVFLAIADDASIRRASPTAYPAPDAGFRAERRRHAHRQADRCDRARDPLLGEAGITSATHPPSYAAEVLAIPARRGRIRHVLLVVPWPGRTRRQKASSIMNDSFLALVSDQGLRTIVIIGRPGTGSARLAQQRARPSHVGAGSLRRRRLAGLRSVHSPGQPYSTSTDPQH